MTKEIELLVYGVILGLFAGSSPGPLLVLTISETLKYGRKEGIRIVLSPLLTDLPIFIFILLLLTYLTQNKFVFGLISIFGAFYLFYLGIKNLNAKPLTHKISSSSKDALRKGIITNFLNPSPYLFWLTIGGPIILANLKESILLPIIFIFGFYSFFIGFGAIIILVVEKSKKHIGKSYYKYFIKSTGIALLFLSIILFRDGLKFFDI
jgi:threonine/homoserine/homoserine lactone efflux protein